MLRVCHIVLSLDYGGMENGIINVANRLVEKGVESHIVCIRRLGTMADRLSEDVRGISLDVPAGFSLRGVLAVIRYVSKHRIPIIYTHNRAPLMYGGLARMFLPSCHHIHGEHGTITQTGKVARFFLRRADSVTVVSPSLVQEVRERYGVPRLTVGVLLNGVDLRRFRPKWEQEQTDTPRLFSLGLSTKAASSTAKDVCFVIAGRLKSVKNVELAIRALANLLRKPHGTDYEYLPRLIIAGDGDERKRLEELTRNFGIAEYVTFLGFVREPAVVFSQCDVLLLPSVREGLPNVALEAAACGLPVLASRIPGNDVVVRHGETGYLLPLDDVPAWTEAMHRLAREPALREKMGRAGRRWMEEEFSLDAMAERYYRLYQRVGSPES